MKGIDTTTTCPNCAIALHSGNRDSDAHLPSFPRYLLETNDPPTYLETSEVQNALDESKAQILRLDNTITALQASLEKHRRLRQSAADQLRRGSIILSVVRRIPTDVLVEIFNLTVPDAARKHATNRCPWVLGRVCSRWRAISLALPELWTTIDRKIPLAMVKAHIDRSLPHPLTVELGFSDTGSVELLIACSARWAVADVEMRAFMGPALAKVQGRLPLLRRLRYNDNNGFRSFSAFENAPALRDVTLSGKASLHLPWSQLERLNMKVSDSVGLSQLRQAHNLVALSVTGRPYEQPQPGGIGLAFAPTVELPRLRTLLIKDGVFLRSLVLPALEDIYISMDISAVPSLVERSNCHLRIFTTDVQCSAADILAVLEHSPGLVQLRSSAVQDALALLTGMTVPPLSDANANAYARPLVPALRALLITGVGDAPACAQLVAMMESRRASTMCAEPVVCVLDFVKWAQLNLHAVETLRLLKQRGFHVEWLTGPQSLDRYRSWRPSYP
ncbi:hypothetical protein C8F04DRAFT_1399510 [Mycena alexandri]|uniref:F-box domain-containing protein n=1 Tax=Mycena alexandri TaxID=1745969 RepID=A0AAD6SG31_9AGAR|nr:hypothetical protein C8F04DRAFT_1399510 [Mycena alexandri]